MNRIRITLTSFLAYGVMAGMLSQIGILIGPMAEHYGRPVTEIAGQFSWLTVGILAGSFISLVIFDLARIRTLSMAAMMAIAVSIAGFALIDSHRFNALLFGIIGVSCGIALPAAAIVIARSWNDQQRASMLVVTDASFSLSGTLCSALAVLFITMNLHWSAGYWTVAAMALVTLVITLLSTYPEVSPEEKSPALTEVRSWPVPVYLCMIALFVYLVGQNFILIWLPGYSREAFQASEAAAGGLVSNFWAGMLAGQLLAATLLIRMKTRHLTMLAACMAMLATLPLWLFTDVIWLSRATFVWGFLTLGLLKLILSWATEAVPVPGPRLISTLLLAATTGTAVSPALSSLIVSQAGMRLPIQIGSFCFLIVLIVLSPVFLYKRSRHA